MRFFSRSLLRIDKRLPEAVFVIDHKAVHLFSVKVFLHDAFI